MCSLHISRWKRSQFTYFAVLHHSKVLLKTCLTISWKTLQNFRPDAHFCSFWIRTFPSIFRSANPERRHILAYLKTFHFAADFRGFSAHYIEWLTDLTPVSAPILADWSSDMTWHDSDTQLEKGFFVNDKKLWSHAQLSVLDCYYVVEISNGSVCAPVAGPVSGIEA